MLMLISVVRNTGEMGVPADLRVDLTADPKYETKNKADCLVGKDQHLTLERSTFSSISRDDDNDDCLVAYCDDDGKKDSSPARSGKVAITSDERKASNITYFQTVRAESAQHGSNNDADKVHFLVGRERQEMIGRKSQLAEVSPVFKAMFEGPLQEESGAVTVPDVEPWAFDFLLRFAVRDQNASDFDLDLADSSRVWEVLKASDKYDVRTLTDTCFRFLSQQHPRRRRSQHLCSVLETAHRLNYTQHHQQALIHVKQHAARVFKNRRALAELCPQCFLYIVTADDLKEVDEILVHDAVLVWAHQICVNQRSQLHPPGVQLPPFTETGVMSPSWKELRSVARDLVKHVRYLTIRKYTLEGFRIGDPTSCLLTAAELNTLLNGDASLFPDTVRVKRGKAKPAKTLKVKLRRNR